MIEFIDISVPVRSSMPTWPGTAGVEVRTSSRQEGQDLVTDSSVVQNLHVGTHIDAPLHFLAEGDPVDIIPLEGCVGSAYVADLRGVDVVDATTLDRANIPDGVTRLLMRTDNGSLWDEDHFSEDYVALTPDASEWVVAHGLRLVGIDYLSVQRFGGDPETHRLLLREGVIIVEGLDLRRAPVGVCELICLPIRYQGLEAAPVRAVLCVERVS